MRRVSSWLGIRRGGNYVHGDGVSRGFGVGRWFVLCGD